MTDLERATRATDEAFDNWLRAHRALVRRKRRGNAMRKTLTTIAAIILGAAVGGLVVWVLSIPTNHNTPTPIVTITTPPASQTLPACEQEDSLNCVWDSATRGERRQTQDSPNRYVVNGPQER